MIGRYVSWSNNVGRPHYASWSGTHGRAYSQMLSQYRFEIVPGIYGKINRRSVLKVYKLIDKNPRKKELITSIHRFEHTAYRIKDDIDAIIHYITMLGCKDAYDNYETIENKFLSMINEINMGPLPLNEIVNHKY
jgi:hypothetical protein